MKTRIISIFLLLAMALALFTGCGEDKEKVSVISESEAVQIAIDASGLAEDEFSDVHVHVLNNQAVASYGVYITVGEQTYTYVIAAITGEVLSSGVSDEAHSHSH